MKAKFLTLAIVFGLVCVPALGGSVVIDFDSLEVANSLFNEIPSGTYSEDGFTLTGTPMFYGGQSHFTYAGSAGLYLLGSGAPVTLALTLGGFSFDLFSIDLSFLDPSGTSPPVTFTGLLTDGSTTVQTFTPNQFGFVTFNFNDTFRSLTSLGWNQGSNADNAHQFDNIMVSVPEPATLTLLGIGLLAGAVFRKRYLR